MHTKRNILLLVLVGATAAVLAWCLRGAAPLAPEAQVVERDPSRHIARAHPRSALRDPRPSGSAVGSALQHHWLVEPGIAPSIIAGVVLGPDGDPQPGATVELRSEIFLATAVAPLRSVTDAQGRFDFGDQLPAPYVLSATADSLKPATLALDLRDPDERARAQRLIVPLRPCQRHLHGIVRDRTAEPVPSARIVIAARASDRSHFLEAGGHPVAPDGRFAMCAPQLGEMVHVTAPGYATVRLDEPLPAGPLEVVLVPGGSVEGVIRAPDGSPIEAARVVIIQEERPTAAAPAPIAMFAASDPAGRFRIEGVAPGRYMVLADYDQYRFPSPAPEVEVSAGGTAEVELTMEECRMLAGVVLEDHRPVAGARVRPGYGDPPELGAGAFTQHDGSFVLGCTDSETHQLVVEQHMVMNPVVPAGRESLLDLIVHVRPRPRVSGRVTANGRPVAGAVVAAGDPVRRSIFAEAPAARSDTAGHYELGLPPGAHALQAVDPTTHHRSSPRPVAITADQPANGVDLELDHDERIVGSLVDPGGVPVPNVMIMAHALEAPGRSVVLSAHDAPFAGTTDEEGRFEIRGLAPAAYRLCVDCVAGTRSETYYPADGTDWPTVRVEDGAAPANVRLTIRSRVGQSIRGQVRYGDGAPAAYAHVEARWPGSRTVAGADGGFVLTSLLEGTYTLMSSDSEGVPGIPQQAVTGHDQVVLVIPSSGTLTGTVVGGTGVCSIVASHRSAEPGLLEESVAEVTGIQDFAFEAVRPGSYVVRARCGELVGAARTAVAPGETARVRVEVGAATSIRGRATSSSGRPIADAICSVPGALATTDADGRFSLDGVVPGTVTVRCVQPSMIEPIFAVRTVEASPGVPASVELTLAPP